MQLNNFAPFGYEMTDPRYKKISLLYNKQNPSIKLFKKIMSFNDIEQYNKVLTHLQFLKQLAHPNLMKIFEIEYEQEILEIIVYCQYPDKIIELKYIEPLQSIKLFCQILQTLLYFQSKGLPHFEIKSDFLNQNQNEDYYFLYNLEPVNIFEKFQFNIDNFKMLYITPIIFNNIIKDNFSFEYDISKAQVFELSFLILETFEEKEVLQDHYNFDKKSFNIQKLNEKVNELIEKQENQQIKKLLTILNNNVFQENEEKMKDARELIKLILKDETLKEFINRENLVDLNFNVQKINYYNPFLFVQPQNPNEEIQRLKFQDDSQQQIQEQDKEQNEIINLNKNLKIDKKQNILFMTTNEEDILYQRNSLLMSRVESQQQLKEVIQNKNDQFIEYEEEESELKNDFIENEIQSQELQDEQIEKDLWMNDRDQTLDQEDNIIETNFSLKNISLLNQFSNKQIQENENLSQKSEEQIQEEQQQNDNQEQDQEKNQQNLKKENENQDLEIIQQDDKSNQELDNEENLQNNLQHSNNDSLIDKNVQEQEKQVQSIDKKIDNLNDFEQKETTNETLTKNEEKNRNSFTPIVEDEQQNQEINNYLESIGLKTQDELADTGRLAKILMETEQFDEKKLLTENKPSQKRPTSSKGKLKDFLRRKSVKRDDNKKKQINIGPSIQLISQKEISKEKQNINPPMSMRKIQKNFNFSRQSVTRKDVEKEQQIQKRNKSALPIKRQRVSNQKQQRSTTPDFNYTNQNIETEVIDTKKQIREFFNLQDDDQQKIDYNQYQKEVEIIMSEVYDNNQQNIQIEKNDLHTYQNLYNQNQEVQKERVNLVQSQELENSEFFFNLKQGNVAYEQFPDLDFEQYQPENNLNQNSINDIQEENISTCLKKHFPYKVLDNLILEFYEKQQINPKENSNSFKLEEIYKQQGEKIKQWRESCQSNKLENLKEFDFQEFEENESIILNKNKSVKNSVKNDIDSLKNISEVFKQERYSLSSFNNGDTNIHYVKSYNPPEELVKNLHLYQQNNQNVTQSLQMIPNYYKKPMRDSNKFPNIKVNEYYKMFKKQPRESQKNLEVQSSKWINSNYTENMKSSDIKRKLGDQSFKKNKNQQINNFKFFFYLLIIFFIKKQNLHCYSLYFIILM